MKIGWWDYGMPPGLGVTYNAQRGGEAGLADGGFHNRTPVMEALRDAGHEIWWFGPKRHPQRKRRASAFDDWPFNEDWIELHSRQHDQVTGIRNMFNDLGEYGADILAPAIKAKYTDPAYGGKVPRVDVLYVKLNTIGPNAYDACVSLFWTLEHGGVGVIYDGDNFWPTFWSIWRRHFQPFLSDERLVKKIFHASSHAKPRRDWDMIGAQLQVTWPYDPARYSVRPRWLSSRIYPIGYIGNDYYRTDRILEYADAGLHLWGRWDKPKAKPVREVLGDRYHGALPPQEVVRTYGYCAAVLLVHHKEYRHMGLMTQRVNEAAYAGTLPLCDWMRGVEDYVPKEYVVSNVEEARKVMDEIRHMSDEEYLREVRGFRDHLGAFAHGPDVWVDMMERAHRGGREALEEEGFKGFVLE